MNSQTASITRLSVVSASATIKTKPTQNSQPELSSLTGDHRYLAAGLLCSLIIHACIVTMYLWQPSQVAPPVAAAPFTITLAVAATSPQESNNLHDGPAQQAAKPQPKALKPKPKPILQQIEAPELQRDSPFHKKSAKPKPKPTPKPPPEKNPSKPIVKVLSPSKAMQESAPKSAQLNTRGEQLTAPVHGMQSQLAMQAKLSWQQLLHMHLEKHKKFPRHARRLGQQGVPKVTFTIDRAGRILSLVLSKASNFQLLDKEAQELVLRAQPLPPPPEEVKGDRISFTIPIEFSL